MEDLQDRPAVSAERLDAWVLAAQPGAMLWLGQGSFAPHACGAVTALRVGALASVGLVAPCQKRRSDLAGHPLDYLVQRTKVAVPPGFPKAKLPQPSFTMPSGIRVTGAGR